MSYWNLNNNWFYLPPPQKGGGRGRHYGYCESVKSLDAKNCDSLEVYLPLDAWDYWGILVSKCCGFLWFICSWIHGIPVVYLLVNALVSCGLSFIGYPVVHCCSCVLWLHCSVAVCTFNLHIIFVVLAGPELVPMGIQKAVLALKGVDVGPPRAPYTPPSQSQLEKLKQGLESIRSLAPDFIKTFNLS